jgi:hypothetical protein
MKKHTNRHNKQCICIISLPQAIAIIRLGRLTKKLYTNTFGGFREVISNRPSKEFAKETPI